MKKYYRVRTYGYFNDYIYGHVCRAGGVHIDGTPAIGIVGSI